MRSTGHGCQVFSVLKLDRKNGLFSLALRKIPWVEQRHLHRAQMSEAKKQGSGHECDRGCEGGSAFWVHASVFLCFEVTGTPNKDLTVFQSGRL